ncbi:unnamed protein product [Cyprideis torosa]|uniref:Short-chain specific acyl-CoA dehydrogenase, mitochondrial n=1 Tax=Cyprideis torosa TaxID=163714 RepID=A0A7R8ZYE8_9CRUS|nr:unnamed protein product [Cyprideis torosa]CAG0908267.1 unnamed protein product [Cyprideis torosa]
MNLLVETIGKELSTLMDNDIRLNSIGDITKLPTRTHRALTDVIERTSNNKRMTLTLALNYSSRWEITEAVKQIANEVAQGTLDVNDINDAVISNHLTTADMPDPELLIRTSGEKRVSNFLMWQLSYTEFHFTDVYWPDFRKAHFYQALLDYQNRERRFGKTGEQADMNYILTEEQKAVQEAARDFAQNHIAKDVIERDTNKKFPHDHIKAMGELGFLGMMTDPQYGGGGMDTMSYVLAMEEISKVDASVSVVMSVNNSLVCWGLEMYGTEEQKQKYLIPLASGEVIGSFCLSEPEAGSDATSQRTTAEDKGDYYLLNGTKNWITNGSTSRYHLVMAQTHPEKKHRGINAFIVDVEWEGVQVSAPEDKLGIRSSDTCTIMYTNVKVPKENRIGEDGFGFKFAMKVLSGGRIGIAAQALGIAAGAYELSIKYAKEREAFGKPIGNHQAIAFKLADMATDIEAARLMVYRAAQLKDKHMDITAASSMAKLIASEAAMKHTVEAIQVHGGYGYVKEYHVERLMRDAKITQIYEGTSEIQHIVISRNILKNQLYEPVIF